MREAASAGDALHRMILRFRDSSHDFRMLIAQTAVYYAYPQAFVERDFWMTEVLRSLSRSNEDGATIVLTGATSLRKSGNLVRRMTEDVEASVSVAAETAEGLRDRILVRLSERIADDVGLAAECRPVAPSTAVHRTIELPFVQHHEHDGFTGRRLVVRLESRDAYGAAHRRTIRSYVAAYAVDFLKLGETDFPEFERFEMLTLAPEHTLIRKVDSLHQLASEAVLDASVLDRLGRSLRDAYDLAVLLSNHDIRRVLEAVGIEAIAREIGRRSTEMHVPHHPRPVEGYATSPAFDAAFLGDHRVVRAYREVERLAFGSVVTLDELSRLVREHRRLL